MEDGQLLHCLFLGADADHDEIMRKCLQVHHLWAQQLAEGSDEMPIIKDTTIDAKGGGEIAVTIGRTMGPAAVQFASSFFLTRACSA